MNISWAHSSQAIRPSGHLRPVIRAPSGQKMRPKTSMSTLRRSSVNWWCHVQQPSTTFLSHPFPGILTRKIMQTWLGHLRHVIIESSFADEFVFCRVLSCSRFPRAILCHLVPHLLATSCEEGLPSTRPKTWKILSIRQKPMKYHEIVYLKFSDI